MGRLAHEGRCRGGKGTKLPFMYHKTQNGTGPHTGFSLSPGENRGAGPELFLLCRQQDPQRKALLQILSGKPPEKPLPNGKESMESCDCLRVASRPMAVHTTNKRPRLDPALTDGSATKMSHTVSVLASLSPLRKARLSSSSSLRPKERQTGAVADIPQPGILEHCRRPLRSRRH
ncbi:putative protein FAM90A5P [Trachypithecus francoisi]|uniref:putative protein FAM90A5P n=1 Tax=Trachypithecus francoisi TaxID=54180 RepID=UPI00141B4125|nr:putative protein FAM90A5P [Trachypithecus francoisi]